MGACAIKNFNVYENKAFNLLGYSQKILSDYLEAIGERGYRAKQILQWIHQKGVDDFTQMSSLNKMLRNELNKKVYIKAPKIAMEHKSNDGTIKWLMDVGANNYVESVYIPEQKRATLCISSQIGCMLTCTFCSTAKQGFNRNLSSDEIIGQLWRARQRLTQLSNCLKISNVVMMGMGEPLLNFNALQHSLSLMRDDCAYGLSRHRVVVSTSGFVPGIELLAKKSDVALALSLHAPNDELRDEIVPINRKYPLNILLETCRTYLHNKSRRDKITIEYIMLDGVNDSIEQAKGLIKLLQGLPCKINLIPFNPFLGSIYRCSDKYTISKFSKQLRKSGFTVTVRKTRGQDINAACGQLVGNVQDKTKRQQRYLQLMI